MSAQQEVQQRRQRAECRITQLQIVSAGRPHYVRTVSLAKADKHFPKLALAANKLQSAHTTSAAAECKWFAWGCTYTSLFAWGCTYTSLCYTLCLEGALLTQR